MKTGEEGWFATFEMPKKTAMLFKEEKEKKYLVRMELQPSGNWVVKWRGLTGAEKAEKQRQAKMMKNIVS